MVYCFLWWFFLISYRCLQELASHKILSVEDCDHVETEYKVFIGQAKYYSSDEFGAYDVKSNSLDSFYVGHEINQKFPNLWELMKIVFVLSHGQASVERGFSVNKEVLTGNMKGRTIIALRTVYDAMRRNLGVLLKDDKQIPPGSNFLCTIFFH